jgi:RND family efflux transporter MFP subunit
MPSGATTGRRTDDLRLDVPSLGRRHRDAVLVAGLAAITVASVGIAIDLSRQPAVKAPHLLMVAPLTRGRVVGTVRAAGELLPADLTTVSQGIAGRLTRITVRAGEHVVAGQILARFDPLALHAELARAEARSVSAEVAALESEVEMIRHRLRQPQDDELARPEERDADTAGQEELLMARAARAAAEVDASEAAYRLARHRLAQGIVRAPKAGVIVQRMHNEGDVVTAGALLFQIAPDASPLQLEVPIPEASSGAIEVGQSVQFTVPAHAGRQFLGRVHRLLPLAGPANARRLPTIVAIGDARDGLRAGMTAAVTIRTGGETPVLRVPSAALMFAPRNAGTDQEDPAIWLVGDKTWDLRRVPVNVGALDGAFAEIRATGLREGAAVAVGYASIK